MIDLTDADAGYSGPGRMQTKVAILRAYEPLETSGPCRVLFHADPPAGAAQGSRPPRKGHAGIGHVPRRKI